MFSTGMIGSIWHLSPEQLEGVCYSGEKIDIWGMGVLLYPFHIYISLYIYLSIYSFLSIPIL